MNEFLKFFSTRITCRGGMFLSVVLAIVMGAICTADTYALTFQQAADVAFTFNPKINISIAGGDLTIESLSPGASSDSNIITIQAGTNSLAGYTLYAAVGDGSGNNTTNLVNGADVFVPLSSTAASLNDFADNTWGYSYSTDSGTSWVSGANGSAMAGYNGLPLYSTGNYGVSLVDTSDNNSTSLQFKIGAKASVTQASGTYVNVVTFTAIPKLITTDYTITYDDTSGVVTGMPAQSSGTASNGVLSLTTDTPSRADYIFDGWCSVAPTDGNACSGITYNPGGVYVLASTTSAQNITLYAMWERTVALFGGITDMQDMTTTICANASVGDSVQLRDSRDSKFYWVTKLGDNNCWMTQNLDLDITADGFTDADTDLNSTTAWNPSSTYAPAATETTITSKNVYTATSSWDPGDYAYDGTTNSNCDYGATSYADCTDHGFSATDSPAIAANHYHVGNFYQWNTATAGSGGTIAIDVDDEGQDFGAQDSICPKGWRLPTGGSTGEFQSLATTYAANLPVQALLNSPLYFVRGGAAYSGVLMGASNTGAYWSSSPGHSDTNAYYFSFTSTNDIDPNGYDGRFFGFSVRCIAR